MTEQKNTTGNGKAGQFVLGSDHFAKISAVDGIRLTAAMKKRASEAQTAPSFKATARGNRSAIGMKNPCAQKNLAVP